jgi:hypothetical protein
MRHLASAPPSHTRRTPVRARASHLERRVCLDAPERLVRLWLAHLALVREALQAALDVGEAMLQQLLAAVVHKHLQALGGAHLLSVERGECWWVEGAGARSARLARLCWHALPTARAIA